MKPYYEANGITLFLGDCREVMPLLGVSIDAVICDPPYGTTSNKWDSPIPLDVVWQELGIMYLTPLETE
jgi:tRNA G10  N-methylase Trm11